jgi:predicted Zn finger-like uncharacterized protein
VLTQCPNCETTFRVTSEILRVAEGQVRCGRCQTQFDALQRLIDERPPPGIAAGRQPRTAASAAVPAEAASAIEVEEERETLEEITMEGKRIEISGTYRVLDESGAHEQLRQEVVEEWMEIDEDVVNSTIASDNPEFEGTAGYEVSEESFNEAADAEIVEEPAIYDDLEDSRERLRRDFESMSDDAGEPEQQVDDEIRPQRRAALDEPAEEESYAEDDPLPDLLPGGRARSQPVALIWKILAAPLVLLLIAQLVHHNRSELARDPRFGERLMSIYRALNLELTPDWDLHAYEIRQWGVITDASVPGTLKVRASIINRAAFPQPYPLLKLVLEDRWGDQVRAREFEPADYLDRGLATDRLFAPGTQTNATVVIIDPGPDAEGFRFDVCLKGAAGPVCAADVPEATRK